MLIWELCVEVVMACFKILSWNLPGWRDKGTMDTPVRIPSFPAKIRIRNLENMGQVC
jgi:hypothetical protein